MGRGIRIFALAGVVIGLLDMWKGYQKFGKTAAFQRLTGYNLENGSWDYKTATAGLAMAGGAIGSMVAAKVGVNRYTPKGINL